MQKSYEVTSQLIEMKKWIQVHAWMNHNHILPLFFRINSVSLLFRSSGDSGIGLFLILCKIPLTQSSASNFSAWAIWAMSLRWNDASFFHSRFCRSCPHLNRIRFLSFLSLCFLIFLCRILISRAAYFSMIFSSWVGARISLLDTGSSFSRTLFKVGGNPSSSTMGLIPPRPGNARFDVAFGKLPGSRKLILGLFMTGHEYCGFRGSDDNAAHFTDDDFNSCTWELMLPENYPEKID